MPNARPPTLGIKALKLILVLQSDLPEECGKLWVTVDEMRQRLVEAGVYNILTNELVDTATKEANWDGLLSRRTQGKDHTGGAYYPPSVYALIPGAPLVQRNRFSGRKSRGLSILPPKDYFHLSPDALDRVARSNQALVYHDAALKNYRKDEAVKVKEEKGKKIDLISIILSFISTHTKRQREKEEATKMVETQTETVEARNMETQTGIA